MIKVIYIGQEDIDNPKVRTKPNKLSGIGKGGWKAEKENCLTSWLKIYSHEMKTNLKVFFIVMYTCLLIKIQHYVLFERFKQFGSYFYHTIIYAPLCYLVE